MIDCRKERIFYLFFFQENVAAAHPVPFDVMLALPAHGFSRLVTVFHIFPVGLAADSADHDLAKQAFVGVAVQLRDTAKTLCLFPAALLHLLKNPCVNQRGIEIVTLVFLVLQNLPYRSMIPGGLMAGI